MQQALFITIMGMGGVFAFLCLLIISMNLLSLCARDKENLDKVALAVVYARRGK